MAMLILSSANNWTPWFTSAFVCGILTIIICSLSYIFGKRKIVLLFRLTFDVISVVYGICVYYATGAGAIWAVILTNSIGIARDIVYMLRDKNKWADKIFWLYFFEILFAASAFLNLKEMPIALLPVVGSLINNVALYLKDVKKTKILLLFGQTFFITYYVLLFEASDMLTILALISSSMFFVSALVGLLCLFKKSKTC